MIQILPYNTADPEIQAKVARIIEEAPVKNLTVEEVLTALRLMELWEFLSEGRYGEIIIHRNDKRLELCDDNDRFLAMLLDCDKRDVLLTSRRCRQLFGGSAYHWRNIGRKSPVTAVASAFSECGTGYYGRGWEISPHIHTLMLWIEDHINN